LHALNFAATAGEYYSQANDEIMVVLQTESPLGVKNAPEIYALPGIDAIFVGPNDLAANMRSADGSEATKEQFDATMQQILSTGKQLSTPVGLHTQTPDEAARHAAAGWQFIAIGSELRMMIGSAQEIVRKLRPQEVTKDVARY
jgi:4-hydroxy-2-oxoheptanedioate aldolase